MRPLDKLARATGGRWSASASDAVLAVGLAAVASLWLVIRWLTDGHPAAPAAAVVGLLLGLPLAWRRRFPLAVLVVVTAATVLYGEVAGDGVQWAVNIWLLAAYSAGAYGVGPRRDIVRGIASAVFATYVASLVLADASDGSGAGELATQVSLVAANVAFVAWIWWFGDTARARFRREAELAERTRQLEAEREENARMAVLDERVRIARELHDVVAHHVSLMGVQAGAARRVLPRQPDRAGEAMAAIEASSRQAVHELHRLLGFLRRDQTSDGLAPQPGLDRLDDLVAQMREAGLPVSLAVEGEVRPLPPAVELSAYRITQEALTNTLRHAGPASASVRLRYGPADLVVEVADDGRGVPPDTGPMDRASSGVGLLGMRERVGLLGGRLSVERPAGGGYTVRAELPLDGHPA